MKSKKFSVMLGIIFCALLAQAQDTSLDEEWDSVPAESEAAQTGDDDFAEFDEELDLEESAPSTPNPESTADVPPPIIQPETSVPTETVTAPPAPEIAPVPAPEPPAPQMTPPPPEPMQAQAPAMESAPSEPPDYSKETRFHNIYKQYNESETPVEAWEQAVGTRQSETYEVQKGDTLSGISTTLFGDQFFWPKIWSLNSDQILNPHEITPGMVVQFYPGSAADAPTLQLGEESAPEETPAEEQASAAAVDEEAIAAAAEEARLKEAPPAVVEVEAAPQVKVGKVVIPPAKKKAPLLRSIPSSLPLYARIEEKKPAVDITIDLPPATFPPAPEYLSYYIAEGPVEGAGVVTGAEMDMKVAGEYQYVFVRLDRAVGKEFVVQKNLAMLEDPVKKKRQGQIVEVQGEIEILEKVNSQKNIYRAIVKKAIQPIEVGSVLTGGKLPMITVSGQSTKAEVSAKIMGGQFDKKRSFFGPNTFVFLDGGKGQGLQEGQVLNIYGDERVRKKDTDALENDLAIGELQIVKVTANFSTGYIVKAKVDIVVGDYVGKVGMQARADDVEFDDKTQYKSEDSGDSINEEFNDTAPVESEEPDSGSDEDEFEL